MNEVGQWATISRSYSMFKIVHNLIVFPPSIFVPYQSRTGSNAYFSTFCTHKFFFAFFCS